MKINGHLEFEGKALEKQLEVAKELKVDELILRYINNDTKISDISSKDVKEINALLKKEKKAIYAIDPLIESFDIYNNEKVDFIINEYEKAIATANLLKVNNVVFRLPIIKDVISEFEFMKDSLDN